MNLLDKTETFDKTMTKRLRLKGTTTEFQAYRVPLKDLRYNVKNDRIATFITQYIDEKGELPEDSDQINNILEEFIIESNPDAFKKTKNNIKAIGQTEVAVVMSDGVVIDGNRRFTTLRQLYRETGRSEFGYLEAVILPRNQYNEKDIKRLELNLQHAVESKVDYNPIERLVGIYRDLIEEGHPFTIEEYAEETQTRPAKVKENVAISKLLVEYLNYINQPEKFHIARTQKIDGPLREVYKILISNKIDEDDKEDVKEYLFANILSLDGDITRKIRDLKPVMEKKESREKIIDEAEDMLDDINDNLADSQVEETAAKTGVVNVRHDIRERFTSVTEKFVDASKLSTAKNQPLEALKKSLERVEEVDKESIKRFDNSLKTEFITYLEKIEKELRVLRELLNA